MTVENSHPKIMIAGLAVLYLVLSTYFVKLSIGLPLRTLVLLAIFGIFVTMFRMKWPILVVGNFHLVTLAAMGALGFIASLTFEFQPAAVAFQSFRLIIQPLVIVVSLFMVCQLVGVKFLARALLALILLSSTVAILQGLDIQPAWNLSNKLMAIQGIERGPVFVDEDTSGNGVYVDRFRAKGLSYSNIHLGYQAALCYLMFYLSRMQPRRFKDLFPSDNKVALIILFWLLAGVVSTATRSSLFGLLLLLPAHMFFQSKNKLIVGSLLVGLALSIPIIQPILYEVFEVRTLSTNDSSFANRLPLAKMALLMFLDRPIGYGWLADTTVLQADYWHHIYHLDAARAVAKREIHNNLVRNLFVYGAGTIFVIGWYLVRLKEAYSKYILVGLIPYVAHSFFHNDGFFLGGNHIWMVMAMIHFCHLKANLCEPESPKATEPQLEHRPVL